MTADPRIKGVVILAVAGLLLVAVVLLLFYGIPDPSARSQTFAFTAWFSAGQVAFLFAALIYTAIRDGRPGSVIPVNSATVIATFLYNVVAALTILVFTLYLLPHHTSARAYYVTSVGELGMAAAYVVMLQLVAVAHKVGHSEASGARITVERLRRMCDVISSHSASGGWTLDLRRCSELIRFSEGLRREPALASEADRLLAELDLLTRSAPGDAAIGEAKRSKAESKRWRCAGTRG